MGRVARSERTKSQLRAEARGVKRAKKVMAKPAPSPALRRTFNAPKPKLKRKPVGVLAPGAKFNRRTGKVTPPKRRPTRKNLEVLGKRRQSGPILGAYTRQLQAEARKVRRDRDELIRNQVVLPKMRRDPSQAKSYVRVPLPKDKRTAEGRSFKWVEKKAPATSRSYFDPITPKAKREAGKADRRLASSIQRKAARDYANVLKKPKSLSEIPGKRESAENLRDLKILSGRSRLDKAIDREKARQRRQANKKDKSLVGAAKRLFGVGTSRKAGSRTGAAFSGTAGLAAPAGYRIPKRGSIILQEVARDPRGQARKNAGTSAKMLQSIIPGLAASVTDPVGTAKETVADPIRRWNESDEQFRKRVRKEGFVPEVLDATVVVGGGSAVASRLAQRAASAGKLGKKAAKTAKYERRELVSAGKDGVVVTSPSRSFIRNAARQKIDARRVKKVKARVEKDRASGRGADALDVEAAERNLPTRGKRRRARAARRLSAKDQGRNFIQMKSETAETVTGRDKETIGSQIGTLNKTENVGYRYVAEFGIRDRDTFVRTLRDMRTRMVANRAERIRQGKPLTIVTDQVKEIDQILKAPSKYFTERVVRVAEDVGPKQRATAKNDPGVPDAVIERRRLQPFEAMFGTGNRPVDTSAATKKLAKRVVKEQPYDPTPEGINNRKFYHGTSKAIRRGEVDATMGKTDSLFGPGFYMTDNPDVAMGYARARGKGRKGRPVLNEVELNVRNPVDLEAPVNKKFIGIVKRFAKQIDDNYKDSLWNPLVETAGSVVGRASKKPDATNGQVLENLVQTLYDVDRAFGDELMQDLQVELMRAGYDALVHRGGGRVGKTRHQVVILLGPKGAGGRMGRNADGKFPAPEPNAIKRMKPAGARLSEAKASRVMERLNERNAERTPEQQNALTRAAMRERGLDPDLTSYYKNTEFPERGFKNYALGGRRAVADDRRYRGKLLRTGQTVSDARMVTDSAAGNIKRKYNWNQVAQWAERSVAPWTRNYKGKLRDLDREARARGYRPGTYVFIDLRKIYAARDRGPVDVDLDADSPWLRSEEISTVLRDPNNVVDPSKRDVASLIETQPEAFDTTGWSIVSKTDYDELVNRTTPSGKLGRAVDMARGAASRWLLLNLPWLVFQTSSNSILSALAGVTPNDIRRAQKFFKELPPEERRALEATFGVKGWFDERQRGGAAFDNRFAHMIAAWKKTEHYRRWRQYGVPGWLEVFSRLDNMQNNVFRRALFYKTARKEAFTRMDEATGRVYATLPRLEAALKKGSQEEVMKAIIKERETVEQLGRAVDDWLGDWTSFTAAERKWMVRVPLFYGFIRFSTRLAFYTLPVNHPVLTAILLKLGDLSRKELEAIFAKEGSEPPPWEYGNFYTYNDATGESKRFTLARTVPFFNLLQVTNTPEDVLNPQVADLLGLINPLFLVMFQQAAMKNSAGREMYDLKNEDGSDPGIFDARRFRLLVAQVLGYNWYIRTLEKTGVPGVDLGPLGNTRREPFRGKQQADSSIVFPRPKVYKRDKELQRNKRVIEQQKALGVGGAARERFAPFIGTETLPVFENARAYAERTNKKKSEKVKLGKDGLPALAPLSGGGGIKKLPPLPPLR